jgi:hypothetical protein
MKSGGSGSKFLVSRAVEEPLEATVELGENIKDISKKVELPIKLGILGFIILIILLIPSVYHIISFIWSGILGDTEFTPELLLNALIAGLIIIFLFAIIITSLLYLTQINKFNSFNLQRCCTVTDLTSARISGETKSIKTKKSGKHYTNPIFALMDLEEESMHVLPQIVKMLRFCVFFIGISLVVLILTYVLKFGIDYNLLFSMDIVRMGIGIVVIVKFLIVLVLLMGAETNFRYIHTRHNIIDSVRFEKDIRVPKGENPLARLMIYLKNNDPYIRSSVMADKMEFSEDVKLKGISGKEHVFDAYFSGMNILKEKSVSLGMPMGKFAVFLKVFKDDITLNDLKNLREAAIDVCKKENAFPLRIISLQWVVRDLSDEVYDYVLYNPISTKNTLTHLEVIAEDDKVYSFIPMISYGEMAG